MYRFTPGSQHPNRHSQHNFLIFSDSLGTVQALQNTKLQAKSNSYIYDIKKKLFELKENHSTNKKN